MYIIYCHTNKINGKKYIGQTKMGADVRWYHHCKQAKNAKSPSYKTVFAQAIRKYGSNGFISEVLQIDIPSVEEANEAEKFWIAKHKSNDRSLGYNGTEGGLNYKKSEEHKEKLRQARLNQPDPMLGRKQTTEAKAKMSLAKLGKLRGPMPEKTKAKISASNMGHETSVETRIKIANSNKNKKASEATKEKMSVSQKKNFETNPKRKEAISKTNKNKSPSIETRKKISQALVGHSVSEETRKKISENQKGRKISIDSIKKSIVTSKKSKKLLQNI